MFGTPSPISNYVSEINFHSAKARPDLQAAFYGDLEYFQKNGYEVIDPEPEGELTCLHLAALGGHIQICRFLVDKLNHGVDFKCYIGPTPLLFAANEGHFNVVKYLIIREADVDSTDYEGNTCLHIAAFLGNREIMKLLLMSGADIEARSVCGTPLQCAVMRGTANIESVRFLLRHKADPNAVSLLSVPSLVWAIWCHSFECLELLLEAGADPNITWHGISPLAVAASEKYCIRFLRPLLAAGAEPNDLTIARMKPIEHAAEVKNLEGLSVLFPVTQRISSYQDWSIKGILDYFHSEEAKIQRHECQVDYFKFLDKKSVNAVKQQKDYSVAAKCFTEALYFQPDNERLLLNRCACWANLDEPNFCLRDAEACMRLRSLRPNARLREGFEWMLFKNILPKHANQFKWLLDWIEEILTSR